jgi:hypothetical protein
VDYNVHVVYIAAFFLILMLLTLLLFFAFLGLESKEVMEAMICMTRPVMYLSRKSEYDQILLVE